MTHPRAFLLLLALPAVGACTLIVDGKHQDAECLTDSECVVESVCDGPAICDPMTHECVSAGMPLDCDDSEPCTEDTCDPASGCMHALADNDTDGYAPSTCTTAAYAGAGGDCDDTDSSVYPGAPEQCGNGIDDNCNGTIDTDAPAMITCYADDDEDGFHDLSDTVSVGCSCPAGYIVPNPIGADCADGVPLAYPQDPGSPFYTRPYCRMGNETQPSDGSGNCPGGWTEEWDYDCDTSEEQQYTLTTGGSSCTFGCGLEPQKATIEIVTTISPDIIATPIISTIIIQCCNPTWSGSAPGCGNSGSLYTCATFSTCNSGTATRVSACH